MRRAQSKFVIHKITTSNRHLIEQVKRQKASTDHYKDPLACEIDNHADTTCFGKNFGVISFTSEVCSVSPYLSEYDSVNDIPICTAATAVELDSGETIILEFGQGLWYGGRLNHFLINPNQCRSYGISVYDDPTDPNRDIGMELPDNYFLPFKMRGTTSKIFGSGVEVNISRDNGSAGVPANTGGPRCLDKIGVQEEYKPYYKYMLIYVDDVLHIAENPEEDMAKLGQAYRLKDSVGPPDRYLGFQ